MGAVKQHFHDEICARYDDHGAPEQEPDILEMLAADAELAVQRYHAELKRREGKQP